jgi:hypothetical protein
LAYALRAHSQLLQSISPEERCSSHALLLKSQVHLSGTRGYTGGVIPSLRSGSQLLLIPLNLDSSLQMPFMVLHKHHNYLCFLHQQLGAGSYSHQQWFLR